VDVGTSVTIVLPAVTESGSQPADCEATTPAPVAAKARVLLVEDEPQVRQFVLSQLLTLGYTVSAAATGREALDLLERGACFDLLFTDVVLPKGMSGVELSQRAVRLCPGLKVLLTSGYSEEVFEHHGRPENIPLLPKPYRRKQLADALSQVLVAA
jgi:CheY-like chemotaxis protein